jgi:pimeloyl-ACP methyl ester carboxylesterase
MSVRGARALAPRADALLESALVRTVGFKHLAARPTRMSPREAAESTFALAAAPWFDDTLRAIVNDHFTGGEQISVPVTIAWGQYDRVLLPRQARRAQRAIPRARVTTLTGCGHVPTYDDPDQVARVLLEGSAGG